jgi:hypothetical protein
VCCLYLFLYKNSSGIEHDGCNLYMHNIIIFISVLLYNHTSSARVNAFVGIEEIPVELMKAEGTF